VGARRAASLVAHRHPARRAADGSRLTEMNDSSAVPSGPSDDDLRVTDATATLVLLNRQADALRAELVKLRGQLSELERGFSGSQRELLLEANEQLVLAAMRADEIGDAALGSLGKLALPGLEPQAAEFAAKLRDVCDANEQLVLAALSAQEIEMDVEAAHVQQVQFLAMVAHELRNPLMPLRLAAQMLGRARTDERIFAKLQGTIADQVAHMSRLIGDLLDGSRISAGKFRLQRAELDLAHALDLAIHTCRPAMDAKQQRLRIDVPQGPLNVFGDQVRLVQVFSNLLENASKYTPEGGEIAIEAVARRDEIEVTVTDNGIGISAQALPHVFGLFVQDQMGSAMSGGGLGIGLAVVAQLVEAHNGHVTAHSDGQGKGSRFVVTLPLIASAELAVA
jgi:signal transduction histidine kinase